MTTAITPFAFGDNLVRVITDENGDPWFVAKDVAKSLEYNLETNLTNIFKNVPEQWKGINPINTPGGIQNMLTISEQGLYFFLGRSDKPGAFPFQKWMAGDVMPTLRKTGTYTMPGSSSNIMRNEKFPSRSIRGDLLCPDRLPQDVRAMRPKLRDRCLNYALQAARVAGIMDMETINELFINYCRVLYIGSPSDDSYPYQVNFVGDQKVIHYFITDCLKPVRGKTLRYSNIKASLMRWCERKKVSEIPSDRTIGYVLKSYFTYSRSNGALYNDVMFTEQGIA